MYRIVFTVAASLTLVSCSDGASQDASSAPVAASPVTFADVSLDLGVPYEWSARAITDLGVGDWSPGMEFSVHASAQDALANEVGTIDELDWDSSVFLDEPIVPTVISSRPAGSIVDTTPKFGWVAVADAISYEVRVLNHDSKEALYTESFVADEICGSSSCELPTSDEPDELEVVDLGAASPTGNTDEAALVSELPAQGAANAVTGETGGESERIVENNTGNESVAVVDNSASTSSSNTSNSATVNAEIEALQRNEGVLAFPGAVGYGKHSVGGRGGRIITVNTVQDIVDSSDNLMSLREAIELQSGPRTIVFSVGGVFEVEGLEMHMLGEDDSFVTVACQTAPSPGVIIRTYGFNIQNGAHDIVFRHCAIRGVDAGAPFGQAGRSFTVRGGSSNIMLDHMSLAWATDENFQAYLAPGQQVGISNITVSNSVVAEGDADSSHHLSEQHPEWRYHAMGPSCNDNNNSTPATISNCSIVNNFIAHNSSRNAMIWGGAGELSNNIIYNWYGIGLTVQPHDGGDVDAIINNNIMKSGPDTEGAVRDDCSDRIYKCALYLGKTNHLGISKFNVGTNYFIPRDQQVSDAIEIDHAHADTPAGSPAFDSATPSPVSILAMAEQGSRHMNCVGSSRPLRDHVDTRVIQEFYDGTGRIGIGENIRNGGHNSTEQRTWSQFGATAFHPEGYDSDGDGMPNEWEISYGTDPFNPNDHVGDVDGDGYTNIEEYLAIAAFC